MPAQAQETGSVTGTVVDAQNGETLPGANVSIVGTQRGTATNANGQYTIQNVQPGTYSLRASFVGFQAQVVEQVEVAAGEETQLGSLLIPLPMEVIESVTRYQAVLYTSDQKIGLAEQDGQEE